MRLPIHSPAHSLLTGLALLITLAYGVSAFAQEPPFLVLPGLESSVDFWKQIFTRYGFADAVLFDPIDPSTVYRVLRVPENEQGRATVDRERARVVADYDLIDDETRIRSQRGAKEHFAEGLRISGRYMAQMQKIFRDEGLPVELAYPRSLGRGRRGHVAVYAGNGEEVHARRRCRGRTARSDGIDAGGGTPPQRELSYPRQLAIGHHGLQSWDGRHLSRHQGR